MDKSTLSGAAQVWRRLSGEQKREHVEAQQASGLSRAAYCRRHELCYGSFLYWAKLPPESEPMLRTMQLVGQGSGQDAVAEIRFVSGQILRLHAGCPEQMAMRLVAVLS